MIRRECEIMTGPNATLAGGPLADPLCYLLMQALRAGWH